MLAVTVTVQRIVRFIVVMEMKTGKDYRKGENMATKIQSLPMAVVIKLAQADLMESYRTHDVQVLSIGLFDDDGVWNDGENEKSLMVTAIVSSEEECFANDCGHHPWLMVWDEDECRFIRLCRWDQDEDNN